MRSFCSTESPREPTRCVLVAMARSRSHSVSGVAPSITVLRAASPCARTNVSGSTGPWPGRRATRAVRPERSSVGAAASGASRPAGSVSKRRTSSSQPARCRSAIWCSVIAVPPQATTSRRPAWWTTMASR